MSFDRDVIELASYLRSFSNITSDWPEFQSSPFPQASIDRALVLFRETWSRTNDAGREAIRTAFCGPAEDGSVNCQWRVPGRFLGLTVPVEGPIEGFFSDSATGEERELVVDAVSLGALLERF